jgi:hypothetical protein
VTIHEFSSLLDQLVSQNEERCPQSRPEECNEIRRQLIPVGDGKWQILSGNASMTVVSDKVADHPSRK